MSTPRLLIVEDDPEMAENLAEVVAELGGLADVALDAERALQMLSENSYSGVLTDHALPGRQGVDLIREMRANGDRTPVAVLSGNIDHPTEVMAEEAGALEVLIKPLAVERLSALLETFSRSRVQVLVVDDAPELLEGIAAALEAQGLDVVVAHTAREALAQRGLPAVAVLDIRLPDQSGLEVARRLAARDPSLRVLFVSGYADAHKEELLSLVQSVPGLDPHYPCVEKPCDPSELAARVQAAVGHW